jgi:hypothetical protein
MKAPALLTLGLLLGTAALPAGDFVRRFALSIEGLAEQPRMFDLSGLELGLEVVEVDDGSAFLAKFPAPHSARSAELAIWLPEVDGEFLVIFYDWFRRLLAGEAERRHADLVAYDPAGNVVNRWRLHHAWPSRIALPTYEAGGPLPRRYQVTLQVDEISRVPHEGAAPWPDILSVDVRPRIGLFSMVWRSAPGAVYALYRWDAASGKPILAQEDIAATGGTTVVTRLLEEEGIYWVVLTSPPPEP